MFCNVLIIYDVITFWTFKFAPNKIKYNKYPSPITHLRLPWLIYSSSYMGSESWAKGLNNVVFTKFTNYTVKTTLFWSIKYSSTAQNISRLQGLWNLLVPAKKPIVTQAPVPTINGDYHLPCIDFNFVEIIFGYIFFFFLAENTYTYLVAEIEFVNILNFIRVV